MADFSPCPPVYADYTPIIAGGRNTQTEVELGKLYRTDYINAGGGIWYATFKTFLEKGKTYRISFETGRTQAGFEDGWSPLFYWKPSGWQGNWPLSLDTVTYVNDVNEDTPPYWCPHNYKLNEWVPAFPGWFGGYRYEFIAEETGVHIFGSAHFPAP